MRALIEAGYLDGSPVHMESYNGHDLGDLRYAASWTLWLDLKILFQTPLAVIRGTGAC